LINKDQTLKYVNELQFLFPTH